MSNVRKGFAGVVPELVLVGRGRSADVYAVDDGRVLRRYRDGTDATAEAAVMAYAAAHGLPVPHVYQVQGPDLLMDRLDGPTLLEAMLDGSIDVEAGAQILAALHARLHAVPARPGAAPGSRLLHLDLHPDNVILTDECPMLIDWRNAADGPPDLDVAMSALIVAQVAVGDDPALAHAGRRFVAEFLLHADGDPLSQLPRALAVRELDPNLTGTELARLGAAGELVRASRQG
ncbi:phosphotransferase [Catellatospora sp. KI3]|uniref:phosphotransferase n=1 Tax=Catellatospora sp. KI3 TaxID=3041620 RepID=UPI0024821DC6|nr:phosphotransferase [Catellatospora sp. KI3]MDI1464674.1 phosphotransferase [Catellatospora sp. KI3]